MPNQNSVTQDQVDEIPNASDIQEHVFWNKELVVSYKLPSGFTVLGRAACIDPANFDLEIGRKIAHAQIESKVWELEGYRKQLETGPL